MMYIIRDRFRGEYLKREPQWGRFIPWVTTPALAVHYDTRAQAEETARFAWLSQWQDIVEIVEAP